MSKVHQVERLVVKAALRVVKLDTLQTDPSYQRDVKHKHKTIVAEFDEQALGIPVVGEREDGSVWIVDGLQRITALRKLGWIDVRAEVFASRGPEHEAAVFRLINLNRVKMSPTDIYRALLTAGDEIAWAVKEAVEGCGFKIVTKRSGHESKENAFFQIQCAGALMDEAKKSGVDAIKFALNAAKECWPEDMVAVNTRMLTGLCCWYKRKDGVIDMERLIPRLKTVVPHKILYTAGQTTLSGSGSGSMSNAVADQIERVYRKRFAGRQS